MAVYVLLGMEGQAESRCVAVHEAGRCSRED